MAYCSNKLLRNNNAKDSILVGLLLIDGRVTRSLLGIEVKLDSVVRALQVELHNLHIPVVEEFLKLRCIGTHFLSFKTWLI